MSRFRGREYIRGFVRDVIYDSDCGAYAGDYIAANAVMRAALPSANLSPEYKTCEEIDRIMGQESAGYGTLYVAEEYSTLAKYKNSKKYFADIFNLSSRNLADTIIVAPRPDCDFSGYRRIIWLDRPFSVPFASTEGKEVIICSDTDGTAPLKSLDCSREGLLSVFAYLAANAGNIEGATAEEVAFSSKLPFAAGQLLFALKVFEELGLISFDDMHLVVYRGVKTDLKNSALYSAVAQLSA